MSRNSPLEVREVNTKNGATKVLNLNVVPYYTPDGAAPVWIKLTAWGTQAEAMAELEHNQTLYVDGEMQFEAYEVNGYDENGNPSPVKKFNPVIKKTYELRVVNVVRLDSSSSPEVESADDIVAAASAAAATDDVPF